MKRKLQDKLQRLHDFNHTSSSNFDHALQLASSIVQGLAEVQADKGFHAATGTYNMQELNMDWATIISETRKKREEAALLAASQSIEGTFCTREELNELEAQNERDDRNLAADIAGEMSGYYDVNRAWTGVDPVTGEKLSGLDRFGYGALALAGVTPIGKGIKGVKVAKMVNKADDLVGAGKVATTSGKIEDGVKVSKGTGETPKGYYQDVNGKWHRPDGGYASNKEVGLPEPSGITKRLEYMGNTPEKGSKTGKEVMERMENEIPPKIRTTRDGEIEFMASDNKWYPIDQADMAHLTDAVSWWNSTGRYYGAKSPEVREWMLDSNNYVLDHYRLNRSAGAKVNETYLSPNK